ncbi:MAG: sugar ABC transporter ATP-binding protein [Tepidisphaeraceae bacterium]
MSDLPLNSVPVAGNGARADDSEPGVKPPEANAIGAQPSDRHALEMLDVSKWFGSVRAVDRVSFHVRRGEVHGLIGENGAGKSTLMKILDGVYPAGSYSGEVRIGGDRVHLTSPHDARKAGIGYVPQEINVIDGLSVAENIFVGSWSGSVLVSFRKMYAHADAFLEQRGIRLDPRQKALSLTASQRQLLMIARALSADPTVLILDEPTTSLTLDETRNLFRLVRGLKARGVTCIFITHKLNELMELADRVTVLRDGAVTARLARGAFDEGDVIAAMVGRRIETVYPVRRGTDPGDGNPVFGAEVLRVEGLTVPHPRLAGRNVVEGLSFAVRAGEVLGIGGLVGSGRSETLNAVYGRTVRDAGRISIEGREARIRNPRDAKRHGIALLTEDRKRDGLLLGFSVRENMTLGSIHAVSRLGVLLDKRRETRLAIEYVRKLNIRTPNVRTIVSQLSGGNQQKALLARALLSEPKVLLLDEPTKGVDVGAKTEIYRLMAEWAGRGMALVVVSSELPELLGLCDRFVVLAGGRKVDEFNWREATEHRLMRAATGGGTAA